MKAVSSTTIRWGMLSLPVQLCSSVESAKDVTFDQASPNGERLRQIYVDPQGNEVPRDQIVKGMFDGDDTFRPIAREDIDAIAESTKIEDMEIHEIVDMSAVRERMGRITGRYFVQNNKKGGSPKSLNLFIKALEAENAAAVTTYTLRSVQREMVLVPEDGNLVAYCMAFADECRQPDETVTAHQEHEPNAAELDMARKLIAMSRVEAPSSLDTLVNEATPMKAELIEQAIAGKPIKAPAKAKAADSVDSLAGALSAMLEQQQTEKKLRDKKSKAAA